MIPGGPGRDILRCAERTAGRAPCKVHATCAGQHVNCPLHENEPGTPASGTEHGTLLMYAFSKMAPRRCIDGSHRDARRERLDSASQPSPFDVGELGGHGPAAHGEDVDARSHVGVFFGAHGRFRPAKWVQTAVTIERLRDVDSFTRPSPKCLQDGGRSRIPVNCRREGASPITKTPRIGFESRRPRQLSFTK